MGGRFWISVVVMFALSFALGFVVHGVLLHGDYAGLPNLLRAETDAQHYFGWMLLADALILRLAADVSDGILRVDSFGWALLASLVVAAVSVVLAVFLWWLVLLGVNLHVH